MKNYLLILVLLIAWTASNAQYPRFQSELSASYAFGLGNPDHYAFEGVVGIRANGHAFFGAGAGWNRYSYDYGDINMIPVFVHIGVYLGWRPSKPKLWIDGGYGIPTENWYSGGFYISPGFGYAISIHNNIFFNIGVALKTQYAHLSGCSPEFLSSVSVRAGLSF